MIPFAALLGVTFVYVPNLQLFNDPMQVQFFYVLLAGWIGIGLLVTYLDRNLKKEKVQRDDNA